MSKRIALLEGAATLSGVSEDAGSLVFRLVAPFLSSNELACLRVVDRAAAQHFRGQHAVIHISHPVLAWAFKQRWAAPGSCRSLTRAQREQLVCITAASNHVPNLKVALAAAGIGANLCHLLAAAVAGALDSCKWLAADMALDMYKDCWAEVLESAGKSGKQEVCEWCFQACRALAAPAAWRAAVKAAGKGHADLASWLVERAERFQDVVNAAKRAAEEAAAAGSTTDDSDWGGDEEPSSDPVFDVGEEEEALSRAAMKGCSLTAAIGLVERHCKSASLADQSLAAFESRTPDWVAKLEWVLALGKEAPAGFWHESILLRKIPDGCAVERFAWLKQRGYVPRPDALPMAVGSGHSGAVTWLLAAGATLGTGTLVDSNIRHAAESGHLRVLQILVQAGCRLEPAHVAQGAASGGKLAVLEWALESLPGFAATIATEGAALFAAGAGSGSVETMRWLHAQGCHLTPGAWSSAIRSGCEAAVELLAELGCPQPSAAKPYVDAIAQHQWSMLPVLQRLGLPFDDPFLLNRAVVNGAPLPALSLLVGAMAEQGIAPDLGAADVREGLVRNAAARGALYVAEVKLWLMEQQRLRGRQKGKSGKRGGRKRG